MIAEFRVNNFYSIRTEQKVSFVPSKDTTLPEFYYHNVKENVSLLKIGFIYGANASGKSTILRAMSFFFEMVTMIPDSKVDGISYLPFMLDESSRNEDTCMNLVFYIESEKYEYGITFNRTEIKSESLYVYASTRKSAIFTRSNNEGSNSTDIKWGSLCELSGKVKQAIVANTFCNCTVIASLSRINAENTRLSKVFEYFAIHTRRSLQPHMNMLAYAKGLLAKDEDNRLHDFLVNTLKTSDFNISDLKLKSKDADLNELVKLGVLQFNLPAEEIEKLQKKSGFKSQEIEFIHSSTNGSYPLSENIESDGTKRFLGMSAMLYELIYKDTFISIDEVESSLHYELLVYFIKLFLANSGNSQLLVTTHDLNLLNEDFIRRDTIWFTDKNDEGETVLIRLSDLGLHKSLSPYNAYIQGKLVKLPFTGSIFLDRKEDDGEP